MYALLKIPFWIHGDEVLLFVCLIYKPVRPFKIENDKLLHRVMIAPAVGTDVNHRGRENGSPGKGLSH